MRGKIDVHMRNRKWVVHVAPMEEPLASFDLRDDAIKAAKRIAARHRADVVVFDLDEQPIRGVSADGT